jgi:hypothetical protein
MFSILRRQVVVVPQASIDLEMLPFITTHQLPLSPIQIALAAKKISILIINPIYRINPVF